jgi:hypothetical protein
VLPKSGRPSNFGLKSIMSRPARIKPTGTRTRGNVIAHLG